jgi:cephalosporin-C deacetylase-like acetyl esterase
MIVMPGAPPTAATLEIKPQRPDGLYQSGETAVFELKAAGEDVPPKGLPVDYTIVRNGTRTIGQGHLLLKENTRPLNVTVDGAGAVVVKITGAGVSAQAGAVFSPEKVQPSMPAPDDFKAFWDAKLAEMRALPMEISSTPVAEVEEGLQGFDIQINTLGKAPVSGYFVKPVNAAPKSLPAILYVHGAGWRGSSLFDAQRGAKMGMLAFDVNAHGLPNGMPDDFYKEQETGALKDYKFIGQGDREQFYFLHMYLRAVRALDFLTRQPEWDGQILVTFGSSQGGAQAIAVAGLDPRVTAVAANVPALCDLTACVAGRRPGWPAQVNCSDDAILETARYFDTANFARNTKADALLTVGLVDMTCPPTAVFSAYNQLQGEKEILLRPQMGHELPWDLYEAMEAHVKKHVQK